MLCTLAVALTKYPLNSTSSIATLISYFVNPLIALIFFSCTVEDGGTVGDGGTMVGGGTMPSISYMVVYGGTMPFTPST